MLDGSLSQTGCQQNQCPTTQSRRRTSELYFHTTGATDAILLDGFRDAFDPDAPVFLHARQEHRLRESGVDPWLQTS